ncbi:hypothetical protein CHISP_3728 [Chitinispirillum alkaliphilum]|nr:hypothetical protein CHISP_3728 [Chitinispirillum alkaliphilum]
MKLPGWHDLATGAPDDVNGRFEVLGWVHSFTTGEQLNRAVILQKNEIR